MRFLLSLAAVTASLSSAIADETPKKPNVVFILADDLGWTDLGCQGSKYYKTPNIDKLAAAGLRFTQGYTCGPNCQPTRAALMTGQYGPRTGIYTVGGINRFDWKSRPLRPVDNLEKLPLNRSTIGDVMKSAGYATGMFGKWHLGQDDAHHPSKRGFDQAIVSMGKHFDFVTQPKVEYPKGTYLADFLTDKAVDFIEQNKEKPFFLYLPHFGVHSPFEAKPDLVAKFKGQPTAGGHSDPTYAAMIASVDESVGRVVATLEELKLTENTIVIFSSDNGGVGGYVREGLKKAGDITDNAPLRSGKGSLYEGGVRVPWIVRWPGKVPTGITDTPIISVDLLPTLIELSGAKPPKNQTLDGVSMLGCFASGGKNAPTRDLFWHFPGYLGAGQGTWRTTPAGAIRSGDWKLIEFFEDGKKELYDLRADESQATNLAEKHPDKVTELHAKLVAWRKTIAAPMPAPNKK
ncbi:MAG: aryl-sulfate sulfohydrolase [Planctomycetaceae bacterium]|nr:aryl-sulfate sulfohydrolase [Planctomycetaceae bacterium]